MVALIISAVDDVHAQAVSYELRRMDEPHVIVPSAAYPEGISLSYSASGSSLPSTILDFGSSSLSRFKVDRFLDLSEANVWWRRPNGHKGPSATPHPKIANFVREESRQAFLGALMSCGNMFFNDVGCSMVARHKLVQLKYALEIGLDVPSTLVTTSQNVLQDFIKENGDDVIFKTFTGVDFGMYETRQLKDEMTKSLDSVAASPTIFQTHVRGDFDLRVTVVGNEVFPAALKYREGRHPVDSRMDKYPIEKFSLSNDLGGKIVKLVRRFGLHYAALDFRVLGNGSLIFFELNPEGQFLWIEIETGMPISEHIALSLRSGRNAGRPQATSPSIKAHIS